MSTQISKESYKRFKNLVEKIKDKYLHYDKCRVNIVNYFRVFFLTQIKKSEWRIVYLVCFVV